jgi:hypothetical protein
MARKWGMLFLAAVMMLLAGCSGEAALVREALVAALNHPNYEYQGSFHLTGDPEKLMQLGNSQDDAGAAAMLHALQAGMTIHGWQLAFHQAKMVLEMNDSKILSDKGLWPSDRKASVELLTDNLDVYVKTPLDSKYLLLPNNMHALQGDGSLPPAKMKEYQEKMRELTLSFMKTYIAKFDFTLAEAKNLGTKTVSLPNGERVETTHITITLDTKEIVKLLLFAANDAATNPDVKKFAIEILTLISQMNEESKPTAERLSAAQLRAQAEMMVNIGLQSLKQWLDTDGKQATPEKLVEMVKAKGLQSLTWTLDYYIDKNKLPVRQVSSFSLVLTDKDDAAQKPVTVGFATDFLIWNYGKATAFPFPTGEQYVAWNQLEEDPAKLNSFDEKGFLYHFLKLGLKEKGDHSPSAVHP